MDKRIEAVLEELKKTLGLQQFVLHTHSLSQEVSAFGGFDILLTADWLPPATATPEDDDMLPDGTVSTRYSLRFQQLLFAVTQGERSFADSVASSEEQFIQWMEQQTGFRGGEDFVLTNRHENGIEGASVHNNIPIHTDGFLEIEWDSLGRIMTCHLPIIASNQFEEGPFTLTLEAIEPLVRQQLTPIRLPIEDEARFADYYAIDEVFIAQDGTILPYFTEEQSARFPRTVLQWASTSKRQFERQAIQPFGTELTAEEAFTVLNQPFSGVTDEDLQGCIQSTTSFLSSVLPKESGEWELYRIMRRPGIIEVVCRKLGETAGPLRRKLLILLNKDTYEVMNFMDSSDMSQLFEGFTQPLTEAVSQVEAFEIMVSSITIDPKYVFHQASGTYKLSGLLDSEDCVDAVTGELKQLNDL
ncbi:hypothetical protein DVB69_10465 [Sporosarcina sp. BI001-red]|uniref:hypothetical protein n=1 Tax=Sporosarcina sp. BI001-red TaxID=2282866 RepID=UPI000E21CC6F|nr:hypothetical protein [Sporosarcina sp. BI001-red]REB07262.1 hypothetical protein DVB69_10465 [Sporosarcina sp. BI001-red]